eukprot:TRINITY_DN2298_c0_g1_i1.p1 TRINITY_DN2298_c0_g1~~TRINITY_DN2298_c0_g1_i1.p1  ORF type:complete len:593 (+),score=158.69 TRINITY_DN2298_c0_g1_i1:56-1834(+)
MTEAAFDKFLAAGEVTDVLSAFYDSLGEHKIGYDAKDPSFYKSFRDDYEPRLSYGAKRIFKTLDEQIQKRCKLAPELIVPHEKRPFVLISGAGPCGIRAGIECALMGIHATVIDKRTTFSRANILTLWPGTNADLVSLGAKLFFPDMKTQGGLLHLGTREIQMALLKSALLLGVHFRYGNEVESILVPSSADSKWAAVLSSQNAGKAQQNESADEKSSSSEDKAAAEAAVSFKSSLKSADYEVTFKCNMIERPEIDASFFVQTEEQGAGADDEKVLDAIPFDAFLVAEGEWSRTLRRFGFVKKIDKFAQAIGVVVNLDFDKNNATEKKLKPFTASRYAVDWRDGILGQLDAIGLACENIEYLKGSTHFIVVTVTKESLLARGVLKQDFAASLELFKADNLDLDAFYAAGRDIANLVGIPEDTPFCKHNPVQIFDFSSRSRCALPIKVLSRRSPFVHDSFVEVDSGQDGPFVLPIGDALLEPFWPQGLGCNRGFHGVFDSVHAIASTATTGDAKEAYVERVFAYNLMHAFAFTPEVVTAQECWTIDPLKRYSNRAIDSIKMLFKQNAQFEKIPQRVMQADAELQAKATKGKAK